MTDSGNSSGSSTAGDDEFDSRAGSSSISAFLNNHATDSSLHSLPPRHPPPPQLHRLHPSPMFDPLSNFFDPLTRSSDPNPIRNLDMAVDWAKSHPRRPEPRNCTGDLTGFGIPQMQLQPLSDGGALPAPDTSNSKQVGSSASDQASGAVSNSNSNSNAPRNPKKRSRASRRAPTTVLSTDTANFRAMVQEFTGIPDGPFAASPFQRSRLDLFGSPSGPPSYLLRPSVYPNTRLTREPNGPLVPPFISPPPPPPSNAATPNNFPTLFGTLASSPNAARSLLSPNAQNPILDLQALFQSPNKSLEPDYSKPGVLEEFGLGQATTVNTQIRAGLRDVDPTNTWGNEPTGPNNHSGINIFRSLEGNNLSNSPSPQAGNGPKAGYSGPPPSASEFNGDRPGTENNNNNAGSKGEGMVESWICSSDYN